MFRITKITLASSIVVFTSGHFCAFGSDFNKDLLEAERVHKRSKITDRTYDQGLLPMEIEDEHGNAALLGDFHEDVKQVEAIAKDIMDVIRPSLIENNNNESVSEEGIYNGVKDILLQLNDTTSASKVSELLKRYPVAIYMADDLFDDCGLQGIIQCIAKCEDINNMNMAFAVLFEHADSACKGITIRNGPAHFIKCLLGLKDRETMVAMCKAAETFDTFLYAGEYIPSPSEVFEKLMEVNDARAIMAISQALKDLASDFGLVLEGGEAIDEHGISWIILSFKNLKKEASINQICQSIRLNAVELIDPAVGIRGRVELIVSLIKIGCPERIRERSQEVLALVGLLFEVAPAMKGVYSHPVILEAINMFGENRESFGAPDAFRRAVLICQLSTLSSENKITEFLLTYTGDDEDPYAKWSPLHMSSQEDLFSFYQDYSATCMRGADLDTAKFSPSELGVVFEHDLLNQIREFLKVFPEEEINPYISKLANENKGNFDLDNIKAYELSLRKTVDLNRQFVEDRNYGNLSQAGYASLEQLVNLGYYADINFFYLLSNIGTEHISADLLIRSAAVCMAWQARLDKFKGEHPVENSVPKDLKAGNKNSRD
jgi:hypothetical protein